MISKTLLIIHASLTLLLPLILTLLITGCDVSLFGDKNKNQTLDYGPETSESEITAALEAVVAKYNPNTMKVGEWAQLDQTQQLNGQTFLISDMAQNVISRQDDATSATFRVTENRRYFDKDLNVTNQVDTEYPVVFKFGPPASQATVESTEPPGKLGDVRFRLSQRANEARQTGQDGTMTLHNLQTSMDLVAPPTAVASAANCSTVYPNCQIHVYKISYDMVFSQDGQADKLHREYEISPDVPYLGVILSECLSGVVPVENQRIFVKECTSVKNFKFGS